MLRCLRDRNPLFRELAGMAIRYSGLSAVMRATLARRRATVVLYHDPKPDTFEEHAAYLSKRYRFIRLDELVEALRNGSCGRLPPKSLVVTFDDGHAGNYKLLPIFRKYRIHPTVFLCTQIAGTARHFWFRHPSVEPYSLLNLPNGQRLAELQKRYGFDQTREFNCERQALSAAEIDEMRADVDFESHTRFHPVLTTCTDEEAAEEIEGSRHDMARFIGRPALHFSFPNGDYDERDLALVRSAGYLSARTIDVGRNGPRTDPYRLRITGVSDDVSVNILAAQLTGLTMYIQYRLRGSRGGRWPTVRAGEPLR